MQGEGTQEHAAEKPVAEEERRYREQSQALNGVALRLLAWTDHAAPSYPHPAKAEAGGRRAWKVIRRGTHTPATGFCLIEWLSVPTMVFFLSLSLLPFPLSAWLSMFSSWNICPSFLLSGTGCAGTCQPRYGMGPEMPVYNQSAPW